MINSVVLNYMIKGNTFIGFNKGAPELYLGRAINTTIVGNTYINNGGTFVYPVIAPTILILYRRAICESSIKISHRSIYQLLRM
jgi:hypothetical protein